MNESTAKIIEQAKDGKLHNLCVPAEAKIHLERMIIDPGELRKGDVIVHVGTVREVKVKPVNVDVLLEGNVPGCTYRKGRDIVPIDRPKRDEHDVDLLALDNELERLLRQALSSYPSGEVEIDQAWLYSELEKAATAHARWHEVWLPMLADVADGETLLEAVATTAYRLEGNLLEGRYRASSTSPWSNLYEQTKHDVAVDFLRNAFGSGWQGVAFYAGRVYGTNNAKELVHALRAEAEQQEGGAGTPA